MNQSELVFLGHTPISDVGFLQACSQRVPSDDGQGPWRAKSISIEVENVPTVDTTIHFFLETGEDQYLRVIGAFLKAGNKFVNLEIPIDILLLPHMHLIPKVESFDSHAGNATVVMILVR